jgi:hypothetical protein
MGNEQRGKGKKKKKTCCDCLHCKVYEGSTENCRLCFCSERKTKAYYQEKYWKAKKACDYFDDMSA